MPEFRDGLKVLDEDSSTLSFYSRSEINNIIKNYTPRLKSAIEEQLNSDKAFLLWISLPKSKEIKQNGLRTIKLVFYSTRKQMAAKYTIFSIPEYIEKLLIPDLGKGPEYFHFITAPPDYAIEVVQKETYTKEDSRPTWFQKNKKLPIDYWSFQPDADENVKQNYMTIVNPHNYISIRMPRRDKPYQMELKYQVKLHMAERLLWKIFLPISIAILTIFVVQIQTKSIPAFLIPANLQPSQLQQLLSGVGAALLGVFGVILSLTGDRLLRRTRMLLFFPIGLSILIIFGH